MAELVGRDSELAQLAQLTAQGGVVTILGSPGAGKTALALALAEAAGGTWVNLSRARSREEALGACDVTYHDALLVLDGCDDVVRHMGEVVDAIRARGFDGTILATCRDLLAVPGESVLALAPLRTPRDGERQAPAVQLLARDSAHAVELARLLDGLPLLLQLARGLPLHLALAELKRRVGLLQAAGRRTDRKTLVAEVVRWAWERSTPCERQLLARLATLPDDLPWAAVGEALPPGCPPSTVHRLRRRGLLRRHQAPGARGWTIPARVREEVELQVCSREEPHGTRAHRPAAAAV